MYQQIKDNSGDLQAFLKAQKISARDNSRTPFQWDSTTNAGFTNGTPWLKVNSNRTTVNAAAEENDPNSCLNYFRKIVKLRKDNLVLVYGKYTLLDADNPQVYAYTRELNGKKLLVLLNFSSKLATANTGIDASNASLLIGNYTSPAGRELRPYEALVYELK